MTGKYMIRKRFFVPKNELFRTYDSVKREYEEAVSGDDDTYGEDE
jgi:hypothetical protein